MDIIKLLIADDHPVVREGLASMIQATDGFAIVGQAVDGWEAVRLSEELQPDVVLIDVQMPKLEGIEATRQIIQQNPTANVVILSTFDQEEYIYQAIQAGAKGYILKGSSLDDILTVIRAAARGESYLQPKIATKLVERLSASKGERDLTDREKNVLELIARGWRNKEIAEALHITERTVKSHVTNILTKLAVKTRTEALTEALKRGLVRLD